MDVHRRRAAVKAACCVAVALAFLYGALQPEYSGAVRLLWVGITAAWLALAAGALVQGRAPRDATQAPVEEAAPDDSGPSTVVH